MNDITYAVSVDVNNPIIPYNVYVANVLDSNVRYLEITLYQNGNVIALSNEATATASLVTDDVLIDDSVECTISNNIITVPLEDLQRHGNLGVQVTVTEGEKVLAIPFPIQVRVTPNIAEEAQIDNDSLGSYAEVVREIAAARGDYPDLKGRIDGEIDRIDDDITNTVKYVEISGTGSTAADDCIEQNTLYRVYISSNIASYARYSLICVVNNDKKTQYAFTRHGFIMYRSKSGDEAWSEWDYLPNHSLMSKAIRKAVIGGFFGIEADSELDKTYNVHNADVDSYLSKIPYEYATDVFEHSHIDEDFTTLTVNRADRPNILSLSKPSDAVTISFKDTNTSKEWSEAVSGSTHDVKNLIPGHLYYYTFYDAGNGVLQSGKISPSGQIRMIDGGGNTFNIRDLGGWSCDGGTLKYGLIYRGCRLNGSGVSLSNDQILFFRNTLGIRDEIDLRSDSNASGITDTALGIGVDYVRKQLHYYQESVQNDGSNYAYLVKRISQNVKEGRISYIHCSSGADRTGQLSMIIEAVCGVAQSDLDRDYELTSFAYETNNERLYSRRRNTSTNADWKTFIAAFMELDGADLKDKVIRYLVRNGVTIDEINCLRAYFIDGNPAKLAPPYGKATVTKTLANIATDEIENAIELYQPFETVLRPANSYTIQSVTVTMGGSDVTATYYHNGKISIPSVTGDITIAATGTIVSGTIVSSTIVSGVVNQNGTFSFYDADGNLLFTTTGASVIGTDKVYEILDFALSGDPNNIPALLVDNTVDQTHNPDGHYILYYIDSDEVRHDIFNFTEYLHGAAGADGFSPTATVTQTATGATITVTDANGTTTANIANGQDYNLTAQDKSDIAALVLAQLPTTQGVQYGNTSN